MKYYAVMEGRHTGVFESWEDVLEQVENYPGAKYKSYGSRQEAAEALRQYMLNDGVPLGEILIEASDLNDDNPEIDRDAWAVDASCLGNPGVMEYRGVEISSGREIFRVGPFQDATNNIGEFLAIVHALALMFKQGKWHNIYSDSVSGMAWVRKRQVKTTLQPTPRNKKVFELMARALAWLNTHRYDAKIMKWQTERWGEIPADFGRK